MKATRIQLAIMSVTLATVVTVGPAFSATPVITNVTGQIVSGTQISITGSNMVDENTASWTNTSTSAGFEGASGLVNSKENTDGWIAEDLASSYNSGGYVSDVKLMGNKALWLKNTSSCQNQTSCGANRILKYISPGSTVYFSSYVRYKGSWPTNYIKMFITEGNPDQWYFQPAPSQSGPTKFLAKHGGDIQYPTLPSMLGQEQWHHWEIRCTRSTPNDIYQAWWDGKLILDWTPTRGTTNLSYFEFGIPNWDGTTGPMEVWFDRFVISSSRVYPASTVEVSNSSTYGSGTVKWQEPIYLSDGSVQVKLDLSGLGSGPYYLWVTNNRQERSQPFLLSGGQTGIPVEPSGLRVIGQ